MDEPLHMRMLVARQRDAGCIHPVMFGRPQQQAAPARPNVQKPVARLQLQLAADVVELGLLRLGQGEVG